MQYLVLFEKIEVANLSKAFSKSKNQGFDLSALELLLSSDELIESIVGFFHIFGRKTMMH